MKKALPIATLVLGISVTLCGAAVTVLSAIGIMKAKD